MAQVFIKCAVCGSEYEITADGSVNVKGQPDKWIVCQACGAVLHNYSSDSTTFGAKTVDLKEPPKDGTP